MKKLIIFLFFVLFVAGCGAYISAERYLEENPNAKLYSIDDDGDGIADATGIIGYDGKPLTDPDTGKPAEVPDSRSEFDKAKKIDASITTIVSALSASLGVGGLVGKWIGAIRPTQRGNDLAIKLKGVVKSVQIAKEKGLSSPEAIDTFCNVLHEVQSEYTGLEETVAQIKAEVKAEIEAEQKLAA